MIWQMIFGLCFGMLAASGVLTVLTAVGLVPRYIGRVHEAGHILLFENMIILGTMGGTAVTLFGSLLTDGSLSVLVEPIKESAVLMLVRSKDAVGFVQNSGKYSLWELLSTGFEICYGLFSGIFVGSLALAIAEMLDSLPIYFRRVRLGGGLRVILLAVALGKMAGAFVYFYYEMY